MTTSTHYVLLTHCLEYSYNDYESDESDESYYTYELIVPHSFADVVETALDYGNVSYSWNCEYNDCQHYVLDETPADDNEWKKVTDRLSMIMSEFCIDYHHDLICYHIY
jgi:hypothetical protein